jgi:hypothetical protein
MNSHEQSPGEGGAADAAGGWGSPPDYGPRGYLPARAAARARKIVLRDRMGLHWPIAALGAAVVIALAGAVFLQRWSSPPGAPWVAAGPLSAVDPGSAAVVAVPGLGERVLVVRAAGDVRAFAAPPGAVAYCAASGYLEAAGGEVWTLDGRAFGGRGQSLERLPVRVFDGVVYVNPSERHALPPIPGRRPLPAENPLKHHSIRGSFLPPTPGRVVRLEVARRIMGWTAP